MKKLLLTTACALTGFTFNHAHGQTPGISWKYIYSRIPAIEYGTYVEPALDGGYIAGAQSANFFWVFKLDATGTKQWDTYMTTGTGITAVYAIKPTTDSGYVAVGGDNTLGGTDSIGNHGIRDFLVVKLDKNGNITWRKALGGSLNEEAYSVEQTPDGGYIVAGMASSNDGDVTGWHGNSDYWVVKLDASGNITWQKTLGGALYDYATSVVPTTDGGYAVAGYAGSKDGDVTGTHWGGSDDDVWVVKLDASGSVVWQKSYGGSGEDQAHSIRQTSDGGYIVAGSTMSNDGNVTGKHGTAHSNKDYWVIKLDGSGTLVWQKCLGGSGSGIGAGSGNDIAYSVRQTTDGGYIVGGTVSSGDSVNDDITGYHGHTGSDYWVVKLDASGNISWQKSLGGNGTEDARTIAQTADGGYVVAGISSFSPDGDVVSPDYNNSHPWIVKLGGTTAVQTPDKNTEVVIYPNPANDKVIFDNVASGSVLRITDIMGKTVYTAVVSGTHQTVATTGFTKGIYIARIESSEGICTLRFVVNR